MFTMNRSRDILLVICFFTFSLTAVSQPVQQWSLSDLRQAIEKAEQPTVINFWATFCKPCMAEMPHFQKLANQYKEKGLTMIFVSLDLPEAYPHRIRSFINRLQITSPVAFLNETNADEFCPVADPSWTGAIPATLFINPHTGYRKFFEESMDEQQLKKMLMEMLADQK